MEKIIRQGGWLIGAHVLTRAISFSYTIFLARILGVNDFGLYSLSLAYFALFSAVADFGFSRFLIREVSKEREKSSELIFNIVLLRLSFASIIFGIAAIFFYIQDPDKFRVSLILLATLAVLPQTISSVFEGVFAAFRKVQYSAIALFLSVVITALAGLALINRGFGITGAITAIIVGQTSLSIILLIFLFKIKAFRLSPVTITTIKEIVTGSLPYGLLGILGLLYFKIDTLLLSYIRGNFETGLYSVAYKFLETSLFIPAVLPVTLFPVLAKLHESNLFELKKLYFKSLKLMTLVGVAIAALYIGVLPFVVKIFLPNYINSIEAIIILSLSIPFIFAHAASVQVLFSTEKFLKSVLILSVFTLFFNIVLNLIFIPRFGFIAASWVTVASEVLSFIIFFQLIRIKILK